MHNKSLLGYSIINKARKNNTREKFFPLKHRQERYHFKPTRMAEIKETVISVGKDTEKLEVPSIASKTVKWCFVSFSKR